MTTHRETIETAARALNEARAVLDERNRALDRAMAAAAADGVRIIVIADAAGFSKNTVYDRLGPLARTSASS